MLLSSTSELQNLLAVEQVSVALLPVLDSELPRSIYDLSGLLVDVVAGVPGVDLVFDQVHIHVLHVSDC